MSYFKSTQINLRRTKKQKTTLKKVTTNQFDGLLHFTKNWSDEAIKKWWQAVKHLPAPRLTVEYSDKYNTNYDYVNNNLSEKKNGPAGSHLI